MSQSHHKPIYNSYDTSNEINYYSSIKNSNLYTNFLHHNLFMHPIKVDMTKLYIKKKLYKKFLVNHMRENTSFNPVKNKRII